MKEPTQTPPTDTAASPSARHLYEEYRREAEGIPPEPLDPTRHHLKGDELERPDDLYGPTPDAVEFLRHPERWPRQLPGEIALVPILRRRHMPGSRHSCFNDTALLSSDDPNLDRIIEAGWEAD
jgi:hypothetical protein